MRYPGYREALARAVAAGKLELFCEWLRFQWRLLHNEHLLESEFTPKHYASVVQQLADRQLEDLWWRGLIPPPGFRRAVLRPFDKSSETTFMSTGHGVRIFDDPVFERQIYQLPTGQEIRLRLDELERLSDHHCPYTAYGVISVLWQQIGGDDIQPTAHIAERLRVISAALHFDRMLEPAEQLDRLRKLLPASSGSDHVLLRRLDAEHSLLERIIDLIDEDAEGVLAELVKTWRIAQGNLVFWHLPDIHTQIAEVAQLLVPSVADDARQLKRIEAVRGVICAAIAALGAEGVDEEDPFFDASDVYIAVDRLQRVLVEP